MEHTNTEEKDNLNTKTNQFRCRQLCATPWRAIDGSGCNPGGPAGNLHRKGNNKSQETNQQIEKVTYC